MAEAIFRRTVEIVAAGTFLGFVMSVLTVLIPLPRSWEILTLVGSVVVFLVCLPVLHKAGGRANGIKWLNKPDRRL